MYKTLLTRSEAAEYLGVSNATLAVWACTNRYKLPIVKIGRSVRYHVADLEAFVARNRQNNIPVIGQSFIMSLEF